MRLEAKRYCTVHGYDDAPDAHVRRRLVMRSTELIRTGIVQRMR
ncbi:MAG: hypothetical protein U0L09_02725 [Christensenellales bacterium]|nr:hypothetical protein [Christensenellales bacterium]